MVDDDTQSATAHTRKMKQGLLLRIVVHAVAEFQIKKVEEEVKKATIITTTSTVSPSSYVAPARLWVCCGRFGIFWKAYGKNTTFRA
ncbi:hypothetical protein F8388_020714 [Cannabis sativa]|uniref:Uncharacterized protein n=1 Tax=Cannabis sativa TaxID=3483 RepID=A0A7J6G5F5_CANSA|nr:hypothetical protein F8388_020714 [Cannabis sativa]